MEAQDKIKELFGPYALEAETEIRRLLDEQPDFLMYKMLKYFFGFLDENLKPIQNYGGKRYRPGLCLMIAEMYGKKSEALEVAASIELYHNFTLIHDDIEDNDPLRRGRPTVWRLWGINHGINSGDALLILASKELNEISKKYPEFSVNAVSFLNEKFKEVIEGQFLDFTLTDLPLGDAFVNEKNYLMMIEKKTSVLVGASARVASIIAQAGEKEQEALWQYGLNLGLAFQMQDDLISIWADSIKTGKIKANDIYERKKTLPILRLYECLDEDDKNEFSKIYNQNRRLTDAEVAKIIGWLDNSDAYNYTKDKIILYSGRAKEAIDELPFAAQAKEKLLEVIGALINF